MLVRSTGSGPIAPLRIEPHRQTSGIRVMPARGGMIMWPRAEGFVRNLRAPLLVVLLGLLVSGCGINTIPTLEEQAKAKWSDVQNQYQRRADLIPNLVETVKGYA